MSVAQVSIEYACQYFLNKVLLLNAGDRLLVYIDRPAEELVVGELQARALCLGIETEILQLGHLSSSTEMVRVLCDRIASGEFNAICEMADQYFYLTPVWGQAMEEAARLYSVGAMDRAAFVSVRWIMQGWLNLAMRFTRYCGVPDVYDLKPAPERVSGLE